MKVLTEEDIKWKGFEHYNKLKSRFNSGWVNTLYEDIYRQPRSIGYVSKLFRRLRPKTYEEAYNMYLNSGYEEASTLSIYDRGRTAEELEGMAIEWKEKSGKQWPVSDFYDALVLHGIIETVYGNIMEGWAEKCYKARGFEVIDSTGEEDRSCGIDFIAKKDGKTILVQVKPRTFFFGKKKDLVNDRVFMFHKIQEGLKRFEGASYAVMIYGTNSKWLGKDGRFNFIYENLVGLDGMPLVDVNTFEPSESEIV